MPNSEPLLFESDKSDDFHYFDVTNENIVPKTNPDKKSIEFWHEISKETLERK